MENKLPYIVRNITVILTVILLIKIAGYFSIVEERSVNQVFKTISRVGMTGLILIIRIRIRQLGCLSSFKYQRIVAPVLYCLYLLLGLASLSWSTDPAYSGLQWLMTFESFIFVIIFLQVVQMVNTNFPSCSINLVKIFNWAVFPIMIVFIIGSVIEPDTFYRGMRGGEEKRLGGWIMNPNELGMLSSIGAALSYLYLQQVKIKVWPIIMIVSAIIVLALTSSRSSAIGFVLIMGILVMKSENVKLKILMITGIVIAVPVLMKYIIFKDSGGMEEVLSMTGRLPFWTALLNEGIVKEPFLGYGFMRINYTDYFQGLNTYPGKMTHNTFMQVLMNLGFIGFFIVFWQVITTINNFFKERRSTYNRFFIAVFIPVLINSFTEFGIFGEANYAILFYQFLILLFVITIRKELTAVELLKHKIFMTKWGKLI